MEISGKVKVVLDQQTFGSGFTKREVVITTQEQYPQHLLVEFVQDKVGLLADLSVGEEVTIGINLRGREWQAPDGTTKYFNSIQGWKLDKKSAQAIPNDVPPPTVEDFGGSDLTPSAEEMDDLPF
ncbi:MAG: DUF3127 domain-containing protein [Flavobacteriaceae bacterium]|nr:DUF3127 domain-containing protein [Flavobacteriaceae bacterium]